MLHAHALLLMIALPIGVITMFLPLLMPTITGWLTGFIGSVLKRATSWEQNVPPVVGGALHLIVAFLVTVVLVKFGVGISDATIQCLNGTSNVALGCIDSASQNAIATFLVQLFSQFIGQKSHTANIAWKAASTSQRAAGAGRR